MTHLIENDTDQKKKKNQDSAPFQRLNLLPAAHAGMRGQVCPGPDWQCGLQGPLRLLIRVCSIMSWSRLGGFLFIWLSLCVLIPFSSLKANFFLK